MFLWPLKVGTSQGSEMDLFIHSHSLGNLFIFPKVSTPDLHFQLPPDMSTSKSTRHPKPKSVQNRAAALFAEPIPHTIFPSTISCSSIFAVVLAQTYLSLLPYLQSLGKALCSTYLANLSTVHHLRYHHPSPCHHPSFTGMSAWTSHDALLSPLPTLCPFLTWQLERSFTNISQIISHICQKLTNAQNTKLQWLSLIQPRAKVLTEAFQASMQLLLPSPTSLTLAFISSSHSLQAPHWPPCHSWSSSVSLLT